MTSIMENQVQTVMKTWLAGSKIQCRSLDTHIKVFGYTLLEFSTDQLYGNGIGGNFLTTYILPKCYGEFCMGYTVNTSGFVRVK